MSQDDDHVRVTGTKQRDGRPKPTTPRSTAMDTAVAVRALFDDLTYALENFNGFGGYGEYGGAEEPQS
jgi:hypothetical protein